MKRLSAALVCGQAIALAGAAQAQVQWRTGVDGVEQRMTQAQLQDAAANLSARAIERHVVMQFDRPMTAETRARLGAAGVQLLGYLGDNAFFAGVTPAGVDSEAVSATPSLRSIEPIKTEWKLDPFFLTGRAPEWCVVRERSDERGGADKADPVVGAYVLLHADVQAGAFAKLLIENHGATIRDRIRSLNGFVIELPLSAVEGLAGEDIVQYIEPALPRFAELNDSNRAITQVNDVQTSPYNLSGAGVSVMVYDGGGALASHSDFSGRLTHRDSDSTSDHATHVAGTIGGDGSQSSGGLRGMAPGVTLQSYGFEFDGSGTFLYTNPGDLEADYSDAINNWGAVISNNSIGTNTAPNGFPCEFQGNYGVTSALIDAIAGGSLGSPMRIVWANGNERQVSRCQNDPPGTGEFHTTAPPSGAKNSVSVGALNSNNDSVTSFTSFGPMDDGRLKPELSGPGCESGGDNGVTSTSSFGGYTVKCGTSMSSPTVCGVGALLIEDWRAEFPDRDDMLPSTLKSILVHTAEDIENVGPDYKTGYGSVRARDAVDFLRTDNTIEESVGQGETHAVLVVVNPGEEFKATLAWSDIPGTPNVDPTLVNDLDLEVIDPNGVRRHPWTLDPANPGAAATQSQEDHINILEQVHVPDAAPGVWTVNIVGFNVPQGPQEFSLSASPLLVNCSSNGIVTLDRSAYNCASTAVVRVVDCDLNMDDKAVEQVMVTIASDSDPAGQTLILTESGGPTATFEAMIALDTVGGAGALQIADGDTVTATYIDADDGMGGVSVVKDATSVVDCTPPAVSNVGATNIEPRSATITFETDEPASGTVLVSGDCGGEAEAFSGGGLRTAHSIDVSGLEDDTTYHFTIEVEDAASNATLVDNNGACFSFTTPEIPDFFTQQFNGDFDLDNKTVTFVPAAGIDGYAACIEDAFELPVDPAGGTPFSMTIDSTREVVLSGGATVLLYGVSYDNFWVGSNGYITFTDGDTDFTESISDHFDLPRISAMFDDFNPSNGGTVSYKQLSDQVVVTWEDIPEFSSSNSNTFQVQLLFSGEIRITWMGMDSDDSIVGLSKGEGVSPDFFESDVSAYGACGPRPPVAFDSSVGTPANTSVDFELGASDDGLPDPPAMLTYTIESLPANGALFDPETGAQISSAPATLSASDGMIRYAPRAGYSGPDGFAFSVDDGGVAPDGGASDLANVLITVGIPVPIYTFDLDTDPMWTTEGQWAFGAPSGGSHSGNPSGGYTGDNVYGYNLTGNYPNNLPQTHLTSEPIDCSEITDVRVEFRRWLGVESSTWDHASFSVSNDGSNWSLIWDHTGGSFSESAWSLQSYDISAIADGEETLYLRWTMGTTDGSVTYPGWNIDDVVILGVAPSTGSNPADLNRDGLVTSDDLAILLGSWGPCPPAGACPADIDGDGTVASGDLAVLLGSWD